jgi:hypothetical protein
MVTSQPEVSFRPGSYLIWPLEKASLDHWASKEVTSMRSLISSEGHKNKKSGMNIMNAFEFSI